MDTTIGGLIDDALGARSWVSTGSAFKEKARKAAVLGLNEFALKCPELLVPRTVTAVLLPEVRSDSEDVNATLQATSDPWVMEFRNLTGGSLSPVTGWRPIVTGEWDGVLHLEIIDPASQKRRRQSLEWWHVLSGVPIATDHWYVSLDRPWRPGGLTDTLMPFRIYQPEVFFPVGVIGPYDIGRVFDDDHGLVGQVSAVDAIRDDLRDYNNEASGSPDSIWPGRRFDLPGIKTAPVISTPHVAGWIGPVEQGTFRFVATVVWGVTDDEWGDNPGGVREPVWESPPSPVSVAFSHAASPGVTLRITFTSPDELMNFADPLALRLGRTGRRVRLYVARDAIVAAATPNAYQRVDADGVFYLLTEVDAETTLPLGTFDWSGVDVPDYGRRLVRSPGYTAWHIYPMPDQRYEIDFPVAGLPTEFISDNDAVPIAADGAMVFYYYLLAHLAERDGTDLAASAAYRVQAANLLNELRSRPRSGTAVVKARGYKDNSRGGLKYKSALMTTG